MKHMQAVPVDSIDFTLTDRQDLPAVRSITEMFLDSSDTYDTAGMILGDTQWQEPSIIDKYDISDLILIDSHE